MPCDGNKNFPPQTYGRANNQGNSASEANKQKWQELRDKKIIPSYWTDNFMKNEGNAMTAILYNHCPGRFSSKAGKLDRNGKPQGGMVYDCERCRTLRQWREKYNEGKKRQKVLKERKEIRDNNYNDFFRKNEDAMLDWAGKPSGKERKCRKRATNATPRTETNPHALDAIQGKKTSSKNGKTTKKTRKSNDSNTGGGSKD